MVYSNFDARVKGNCRLPADRVRLLRRLESDPERKPRHKPAPGAPRAGASGTS